MEPVTLTTARLLLRTPTRQDTESVLAAVQDPDILRWTTIPSPYLPEHAQGFTEQLVPEGWANGTMFTWGLFLPEGEELVGMLSLTKRSAGTAEIGYWSTKEQRGNGYVTEAVEAAARWAIGEWSIDRVEWRAEVGNHASRAVAERVGFTIEGVLRSSLVHQGVRRDCWVGALLPSDLGLPSTAQYLPASQ
ncbi:GNAT family N-acetyltransferase [Streptomyces canus]|uniref:GNAT family N-acetyltransferase n=1 Tax=Streptomyces canus TaxID=58343 RepID=UPI000748A184|nr:GNAT family protein [Streptomyces canus]KUN03211.1 acetyltransferase [Streptomyces canus]